MDKNNHDADEHEASQENSNSQLIKLQDENASLRKQIEAYEKQFHQQAQEIEKFKDLQRFYVDTATFGYNPSNIRQCLKFFEKGRVVFGTGEAQILYIYSFSLNLFRYCHDRYSNGHGITWDVYEYSLSKCKRFELVHIR